MNAAKCKLVSLIPALYAIFSGPGLYGLPAAPPPIAISPSVATVIAAGAVTLTVTYSGPSELHWFVNAVEGGNEQVGSITFPPGADRHTGLYRAPALPAVNSVTVTVRTDDGESVVSATIVIVPAHGDHSIKIGLAGHPSSELTSYPLSPGKPTRFAAYNSNGEVVAATWTITVSPVGGQPVPTLVQGAVATVTYPPTPVDLSDSNAPSYVLTATPSNPAYSQSALNLIAAPQVLIRCNRKVAEAAAICHIVDFDRVNNTLDPAAYADAGIVSAINSSKTIFSGSVIRATITAQPNASNCSNYDWKIAVQAEESTSVLIYDPSDVGSGICEDNQFIIALPIHVLWADVFGYHQILDPTRAAPGKPAAYTDCAGQPAPPTIVPCDKDNSTPLTGLYPIGKVANWFAPPGNGMGSVSFSGKGEVSFDVQADPALYAGPGWIDFPLVFERGATDANLNSLTLAAAYDSRWSKKPDAGQGPFARSFFIMRKPQIQIRSGPEFAPSHPALGAAPSQARDLNYTWGETIRFPLVFNFHQQPSSISLYPVLGGEEGWHLRSVLSKHNPIARGVTGVDGSFRWPFNITHNFLGPTPIQIEGQYRVRGLLYTEPATDFANLPPASTPLSCPTAPSSMAPSANPGCMVLSTLARKFYKGDVTIPLDPYISVKFTIYGGALPPDFWSIPHSIVVGLSFSNPGSSEH